MKNHRLNKLLISLQFQKNDWKGFEKFVWGKLAPFNLNKKPRKLLIFEVIQKIHQAPQKQSFPSLKSLHKKISNKTKKSIKLRSIQDDLTDLYHFLEEYLSYQHLKKHPINEEIYLLSALAQRKIFDGFEKKLSTLKSKIEEKRTQRTDFQKLQWAILKDKWLHNEVKTERNIHNILKDLDHFYTVKKLHYLSLWENHPFVQKTSDSAEQYAPNLSAFLAQINTTKTSLLPTLTQLQLLNLQLLQNPNELSYAEKLWNLIRKHSDEFSKFEQKNSCIYICNAYFLQINRGFGQYYPKVFEIYRFGVERGLFLSEEGQWINHRFYNAICTTAIQSQEYKWAHSFMLEHAPKIANEKLRKNAENLCWGWWHYYTGDYDTASSFCLEIDPQKNDYYKLEQGSLLLKSWFELAQLEKPYYYGLISSKIESIRKYIERSQDLTIANKSNYGNLFKITERLARITRTKPTKTKLQILKATIEDCENLSSKKWLLAKVNQKLEEM